MSAIYTSYFGNYRHWRGLYPVSVSHTVPNGVGCARLQALKPPAVLLNQYKSGIISFKQYAQLYYDRCLCLLDASQIHAELIKLSNGADVVLLCYEKDSPCHRYLIAKWFQEHGYACSEL